MSLGGLERLRLGLQQRNMMGMGLEGAEAVCREKIQA